MRGHCLTTFQLEEGGAQKFMEWMRVPIKTFGRVITGKTPPTSQPELFGDIYPFITPTDIDGVQRMVVTERFLSEAGKDYQSTLLLPPNAVGVICIGATIGKLCYTSGECFTNQQINSVIIDESKNSSLFLYYALKLKASDLIRSVFKSVYGTVSDTEPGAIATGFSVIGVTRAHPVAIAPGSVPAAAPLCRTHNCNLI